jgi:hypothetical protein
MLDFTRWTLYSSRPTHWSGACGRALVADIQAVETSWNRRVIARGDSSVHAAKRVAAVLDISDVAAQNAIDRLVDAGILSRSALAAATASGRYPGSSLRWMHSLPGHVAASILRPSSA